MTAEGDLMIVSHLYSLIDLIFLFVIQNLFFSSWRIFNSNATSAYDKIIVIKDKQQRENKRKIKALLTFIVIVFNHMNVHEEYILKDFYF